MQPLPAPADYEAYAFAYFAGESTDDGEKIYFGASRGNDPLDYDVLNDGRPVLSSQFGTKGLRDPFIIRSAEGDRFYLLATDLKAYPAVDFGEAQETGSKYLEVWESTDLVTWSDQRHIKVSSDFAGNTWAPEAFYDDEAGEYVVYWASALYPTTDVAGRDINTSYQRMMYATTRDFVTFSEPKPWIDVKRGTGRGMIDATIVQDGETYFRFVKDEAVMTPRQERSTDLRATVTGSLPTTTSTPGWQLVKDQVGVGQPNPWGGTYTQGEGPTVFRDNEIEDRWYMFIDQPSYHGGRGYLAFRTDDIASGNWQSVPTADLPSSPRHGTVIPVTQAELDTMRAAYQPDLLIESVADTALTTRAGTAPALPATVAAEMGDGTTEQVAVRWDAVSPTSYAAPGTFTVTGTVVRGSADRPVATVTVTDAADPVVTLTAGTADGDDGWWVSDPVRATATATDATGVESVSVSVDGAPWASTAGASASALVAGDGTHEVRARAVDTTGNSSAVAALQVRIDASDPVSRATYDAGRRVTIRSADATSGLLRTEYRIGSGAWTTYAAPFAAGAARTIDYRSVDRAGNVEPVNTLSLPAVGDQAAVSSVAASGARTARLGADTSLVVRVASASGVATGTVRVLSGDRLLASGQLVDGRVRIAVDTADLGVGTHALQVVYARQRRERSCRHDGLAAGGAHRDQHAGAGGPLRRARQGPRAGGHRPGRPGSRAGAGHPGPQREGAAQGVAGPVRQRPGDVEDLRGAPRRLHRARGDPGFGDPRALRGLGPVPGPLRRPGLPGGRAGLPADRTPTRAPWCTRQDEGMTDRVFGQLPDGHDVRLLTIGAAPGPVVEVLTLGATVHRLEVTGGDGVRRNVVLGHPDVEERLASGDYIGGTIGRYANRIARGRLTLDGHEVRVGAHDRGNSLHGGPDGFDRRLWDVVSHDADSVELTLVSPDGDQGFPGEVSASVTYRVEGDTVAVTMTATTDATTVVNLTNHAYLNLDGEGAGTIDGHVLLVEADDYTPVDATGIPLGDHAPVEGTPFDFRAPTAIGAAIRGEHRQVAEARGIDHNYVVRGSGLRRAAVLSSDRTATRLELWSDQPGVQVYTGNFLDGTRRSTTGARYRQGDGIALEPQLFPDSPHHPEWPSATLEPGDVYRFALEWRFDRTDTVGA